MSLQIYDINIDQYREPTQADLDALQCVVQAYGELRHEIRQAIASSSWSQLSLSLSDNHARLTKRITELAAPKPVEPYTDATRLVARG